MRRNICIVAIGLLAVVLVAIAKQNVTHKFDNGTCDNGNVWWSVSTYYDGVLAEVDGIDCSGKHYIRVPSHRIVSSDPLNGETPTFVDVASNGNAWYALLRYDADHRVIWQGGKDGNGEYWVTDITYEDGDGTATQGGATPGVR